jgi:hypothetical protein
LDDSLKQVFVLRNLLCQNNSQKLRSFQSWRKQSDITGKDDAIFDFQNGMNDKRRRQIIAEYFPNYQQCVEQCFADQNKYTVSNSAMVFNEDDGCDLQSFHADYSTLWKHAFLRRKSFSLIFAIMSGTKLIENIDGKEIILELDAGDAVIFQGDFIHSGVKYTKFNIRLHWYIDIEVVYRKQIQSYFRDQFDIEAYTNKMNKISERRKTGDQHAKRQGKLDRLTYARECKKLISL